jgi:hypothetical protein
MNQLLAKFTSFSPEGQKVNQENAKRQILAVKDLLELRDVCVKQHPGQELKASEDNDPPAILSLVEEKALARASVRLLELRSKGKVKLHALIESLDVEKSSRRTYQ